jgi:hypothetical protein
LLIVESVPFTILLGIAFSSFEANIEPINYKLEDELLDEKHQKEIEHFQDHEEDINIAEESVFSLIDKEDPRIKKEILIENELSDPAM